MSPWCQLNAMLITTPPPSPREAVTSAAISPWCQLIAMLITTILTELSHHGEFLTLASVGGRALREGVHREGVGAAVQQRDRRRRGPPQDRGARHKAGGQLFPRAPPPLPTGLVCDPPFQSPCLAVRDGRNMRANSGMRVNHISLGPQGVEMRTSSGKFAGALAPPTPFVGILLHMTARSVRKWGEQPSWICNLMTQ